MDKVFPFKLTELPSTTWLTAGEFQTRKRLREETDMDLGSEDQQQNVRRLKTEIADPNTSELWSTRNDSSLIDRTHNASSTSSDVSEYSSLSFNSDSKLNSYLDTTLSMSDTSWTDFETASDSSSHSTHTEEDVYDIEHNFAAIALESVRRNRELNKADNLDEKTH